MSLNSTILYPKDTLLMQVDQMGIYLILRNVYGYYYKIINSGNKASMKLFNIFLHKKLVLLRLTTLNIKSLMSLSASLL